MTTILTAQFGDGSSLILSGDAEFGYLITGRGVSPIRYWAFEDAFGDFGGYVVARTQEAQDSVATH